VKLVLPTNDTEDDSILNDYVGKSYDLLDAENKLKTNKNYYKITTTTNADVHDNDVSKSTQLFKNKVYDPTVDETPLKANEHEEGDTDDESNDLLSNLNKPTHADDGKDLRKVYNISNDDEKNYDTASIGTVASSVKNAGFIDDEIYNDFHETDHNTGDDIDAIYTMDDD
jgi:hypothetical protein